MKTHILLLVMEVLVSVEFALSVKHLIYVMLFTLKLI
jgi:hypothetical protein